MERKNTLKIFMVDDEPSCLALYGLYLKNLGYENIHLFESGLECVSSLNLKPDVIFLDYRMPVLDGVEVLKIIKRYSPEIFVVFVTGDTDTKTAVTSLKYGAFDYIQKGSQCMERIECALNRILDVKAVMPKGSIHTKLAVAADFQ